jgi:hypothetical protein
VSTASIVLFSTRGVAALRSSLHNLWETTGDGTELLVLAGDGREDVAMYLTRQYLRGRISGFGLGSGQSNGGRCGLDWACHLVRGDYLVRAEDDLRFAPGWLEKTVGALEAAPDIGCLGLVQTCEQRRRGRPRKVREQPEPSDTVSTRCFVTRRSLCECGECGLMNEQSVETCLYQSRLKTLGHTLAYLPGQVVVAERGGDPGGAPARLESDLPPHDGATGAMQQVRQAYQLGDDVLITCLACGHDELEVLAARIEFCRRHNAAVGLLYELRCPQCNELHFEEDAQFRCPV